MNTQLFDLYTDYLVCTFRQATATGMEEVTDRFASHDDVTRMLATEIKTRKLLWTTVKPLVRQVQSDDGVVIFDDVIIAKPHTDENDIICWHFDHASGQSVKGIQMMTALYQNRDVSLPLATQIIAKTEQYTDEKTGIIKRRSPVTKNEYLKQMLRYINTLQVPYKYVLADSWYASADNMKFVHDTLKKHFVFALKQNRKVALSAQDKRHGKYINICDLILNSDQAITVYVEEVPFPLRLAKHDFTNEDGTSGTMFLISDHTTLSGADMLAIYKRRWNVEQYHKSLKQNAAIAKSPTRTERTQSNHVLASVCAYVKLESLKVKTKLNHFAVKGKLYSKAILSAWDELHEMRKRLDEKRAFA